VRSPKLTLAQFLALEHAVVYGAGRSYEVFERFLKSRRIQRRVVLETPHFMTIPSIIARSDLVVTVPHAVGAFVRAAHMDIRIAQPPMRTPKIDLKQHWHRKRPPRPGEPVAARRRRRPVHRRARRVARVVSGKTPLA
jgi:hypothetical protein